MLLGLSERQSLPDKARLLASANLAREACKALTAVGLGGMEGGEGGVLSCCLHVDS